MKICKSQKISIQKFFKSIKYYKVSNNFLSENNQRNVNDVLSVTDNEAMRPNFVRRRPALHEAEAEKFGLDARLNIVYGAGVLTSVNIIYGAGASSQTLTGEQQQPNCLNIRSSPSK